MVYWDWFISCLHWTLFNSLGEVQISFIMKSSYSFNSNRWCSIRRFESKSLLVSIKFRFLFPRGVNSQILSACMTQHHECFPYVIYLSSTYSGFYPWIKSNDFAFGSSSNPQNRRGRFCQQKILYYEFVSVLYGNQKTAMAHGGWWWAPALLRNNIEVVVWNQIKPSKPTLISVNSIPTWPKFGGDYLEASYSIWGYPRLSNELDDINQKRCIGKVKLQAKCPHDHVNRWNQTGCIVS